MNVYSIPSMEKTKSFSRTADVIHCIDFRCDGKLFAVGNSAGNVQVFDATTKKLMRNLKGHIGPVRKIIFSANKLNLYSVSDDRTFKVWDVPTETCFHTIEAHDDYIRACAISGNGKIFATGAYDHIIKIWNVEDWSLVCTIDNGAPVEDLVIAPNGSLLISCGANHIKFWNISDSGNLLHQMSPHQKTITAISYSSDFAYLITAGLDRHSKIIDLSTYRVVSGFKFDSPVMSVTCNSIDSALAFGLANGYTVLKTRKVIEMPSVSIGVVSPIKAVKFDFVSSKKAVKFTNYERAFKSFKFRDALDACLEVNNPLVILSCLTELISYNALTIALSGRNEATLMPILKFVSKTIHKPEFNHIVIEALEKILEIYASIIGQSPEIDEMLWIICRKIRSEVKLTNDLNIVSGQLDMVCSSSIRTTF
jgi:U3 small nucleolar RNA-associated protein 15